MIDAAVLIPVYRSQDGELHIVMILRNPGGVHGGQIAFPGGKHDPEDETMLDTALREVRGYRVFPFLARIALPDRWQIAEREIAEIVDVKLTDLTRRDAHDKMIGRFPTWEKAQQVSFYRIGEHRLWGLSYRILQPVLARLVAGEWDV